MSTRAVAPVAAQVLVASGALGAGMRLRSTTGPVEVLVIDRVERPTPS